MENSAPNGYPDIPPPPAVPPQAVLGIDLTVSKRLLWVGGAAYPLQNVARVYTFTLHPRRKDAVVRFVKNAALTVAAAIALTVLGGAAALADQDTGGTLIGLVWLATAAGLIYLLVELVSVLTAPSHYVLAVETSGPSTAVVTSHRPELLNQLVGQIAHAIENPETEFTVKVESISISPRNYHFGDNVNMYGGSGNVGISA